MSTHTKFEETYGIQEAVNVQNAQQEKSNSRTPLPKRNALKTFARVLIVAALLSVAILIGGFFSFIILGLMIVGTLISFVFSLFGGKNQSAFIVRRY
ncbi:MAG: hypothetical protein KDD46_02145 [Bdellovibrionales bacterium]|nr:hypothetical protein [Bdellovibrionales bacterium]